MRTNGGVWDLQQLPLNSTPLPLLRLHTRTHFLLRDRWPLFFIWVSSATEPWDFTLGGNLVLSLHNSPADGKENKARGRHRSSSPPIIFNIIVLISMLRPHTLLFLLPKRSIALIGSLSHHYIDCGH